MKMFDYRYDILSRKELSNNDKIPILNIYSNKEIDDLINVIYDDLINQTKYKSKNDKDIMREVRVYSILKNEKEKRKIKKLEIKFE